MDITTIILVVFISALGITAGYLIAVMRQHTPTGAAEKPVPEPEGATEVLRIWRTRENLLRLGMDGNQLSSPEALTPEQRRLLVKLVIDMRPWLEGVAVSAPDRPNAGQPSASPDREAGYRPATASAAAEPPKPAQEKPAPVVMKSIVEQIDEVLQKKLEGTSLQSRDIQLTEGPDGAVVVRIGLNKFSGIEAVPDAEVRALIKQSITDWEKNTK